MSNLLLSTIEPWQSQGTARITVQKVLCDLSDLEGKSREDFDEYMKSLNRQYFQTLPSQSPANRRDVEGASYYSQHSANPEPSSHLRYNRGFHENSLMLQRPPSPNVFPRNVKHFRDRNIPMRSGVVFGARGASPIEHKVPLYIPSGRRGSRSPLHESKRFPDIEQPHEFREAGMAFDSNRNFIPTERRQGNYPHSYYPFVRDSGIRFTSNDQDQWYKMRGQGNRRRSPYGLRTLQEAGVEDAMEGLDKSLEHNELRAAGPKQFVSWQNYRESRNEAAFPQYQPSNSLRNA